MTIGAFLVVRLPVIDRQPGGQDEEYYAFPGLTIVRDGTPQLPHVPQRDPASVFYKADVAFFAEPPLYFYVQAACYAALSAVYGTARLASLVAGVSAIVMVYLLARKWYADQRIALWSAGLYSLLRLFYFPAITARPDLLCTALGLGAVYAFECWRAGAGRKWFIASGVLIGLGGLTHPFALVYAIQLAAWASWVERGWRRLSVPIGLAGIAIATCALWLPLIMAHPDVFRAQFGNNILRPAGAGLLTRMLLPGAALAHHARLCWDRAAPIQFCLLAGALVAALAMDSRRRDGRQKPVLFAVSSTYLISTLVGIHPGHGYWSYAAAFFAMCLASVLVRGWRRVRGPSLRWRGAGVPAGVLLVLMMVPGLGLRASWAYVAQGNDIDYNAPRFAARIIADLPEHAQYTVGREYVLDFYASGRKTLIGETKEHYLASRTFPFDYLVVSRDGIEQRLPQTMNARLLRTYGKRDDPFACYAEVYVPADK